MTRLWRIFGVALLCPAGARTAHFGFHQRLDERRLEEVHQARLEWSRKRVVYRPLGLYQDFRAAFYSGEARDRVLETAAEAGVNVLLWSGHDGPHAGAWREYRRGVLIVPYTGAADAMAIYDRDSDAKAHEDPSRSAKKIASLRHRFPDEAYAASSDSQADSLAQYDVGIAKRRIAAFGRNSMTGDTSPEVFRFVSTHVLAQELNSDEIRASLSGGHVYVAHDWLCDPSGFSYVAANNLGIFDMGDPVPMASNTRLLARFPVVAHIRLIHNGAVVYETNGNELSYAPAELGAYRLEASLTAGGEERPWIYSNPLYLEPVDDSSLAIPPAALDPAGVNTIRGIQYAEGESHELDLYLPVAKTNMPVLFFVHGATFKTGGRALYSYLGMRFARQGIAVAIPDYRPAPANPFPAQMEEVAAAFAWTVKNIAQYGGDPKRIFVAGHSNGGQLGSLLALDPRYIAKHDITLESIRGVMSLSGLYDVRQNPAYGADERSRRAASPVEHVRAGEPPFLIAYCQWDYLGLPAQARELDRALRNRFNVSRRLFIAGENHVSGIIHLWKDDAPAARAMLKFMDEAPR